MVMDSEDAYYEIYSSEEVISDTDAEDAAAFLSNEMTKRWIGENFDVLDHRYKAHMASIGRYEFDNTQFVLFCSDIYDKEVRYG